MQQPKILLSSSSSSFLLHFYKYEGAGNDFILIDDRQETFNVCSSFISSLCHRRLGIGADGLILLRNHENVDFQMIYFNANGKEGSMCGNGARCAVHFAVKIECVLKNEKITFYACDGLHIASILSTDNDKVRLSMTNVYNIEQEIDHYFLNTGSPHYVKIIEQGLTEFDVTTEGRMVRNSARFHEQGTNVNFMELSKDKEECDLLVRTYERGVEEETWACGTGVTACAIVAFTLWPHQLQPPIHVKTLGGHILSVSFNNNNKSNINNNPSQSNDYSQTFTDVMLTGPVHCVFEGTTCNKK